MFVEQPLASPGSAKYSGHSGDGLELTADQLVNHGKHIRIRIGMDLLSGKLKVVVFWSLWLIEYVTLATHS